MDAVDEEVGRLTQSWADPQCSVSPDFLLELLGPDQLAGMDLFDRAQLNHVLDVCRRSRSLSDAGRTLYSASRGRKTTPNDADRLRKYLARFGVEWSQIPKT